MKLSQSSHPFLEPEFKIPETLETDRFRLRMLTVNAVVKDFDAVISSKQHLHEIWAQPYFNKPPGCDQSRIPRQPAANRTVQTTPARSPTAVVDP